MEEVTVQVEEDPPGEPFMVVGVGPWQGEWPTEDHFDPELLREGDRRNVIDKYRYWKLESIVADLGTTTYVHAAVTLANGETTTVTTGITDPDVPRILSVTGNDENVAGDVVFTGTNIDDEEITMFIVGKYYNANNSYAKNYYQVIAGFGSDTFTNDISVDRGSLVFANAYGNLNFTFGDNSGYSVFTNQTTLSVLPVEVTFTKTFYQDEEWIVPLGVTQVSALIVGGGGGGGSGTGLFGGFGGGGGGISTTILETTSGLIIPVKVGNGGLSLSALDYNLDMYYYGESGGTSYFGEISAMGGEGGGYALSSVNVAMGGYGTLYYGSSGGFAYNFETSTSSTSGEEGKYFELDDTYYSGGGSGSYENSYTEPVLGGGGGGSTPDGGSGQDGFDSLGGGGGAGYNDRGGVGGSGVVKILWKTNIIEIVGPTEVITYDTEIKETIDNNVNFYPPTTDFYIFETAFKKPQIETYINGTSFGGDLGIVDFDLPYKYWNSKLFSNGGFSVGSYVGGNLRTDCSVAEIIFYKRYLKTEERIAVLKYLKEKYNLTNVN
jgi:hypothetical protein